MSVGKNWRSAARDKRPETIHAAYPRLENGEPPVASKALPCCHVHDYQAEKALAEPRTYERAAVTCRKCLAVLAEYPQLGAVLALARRCELELS